MTWGSVAFATTGVGVAAASPLVVALSNSGTSAVAVSSITDDDTAEFPYTTTCQVGGSLAANSTCAVTVQFRPGAVGSRTATLTIIANGTTQALSLSGTGAAISPQVTVSNAGDAAPSLYVFSVTGATPGGTLELHVTFRPKSGPAATTVSAVTWTSDSTGAAAPSLVSDASGTYEVWLVDLPSQRSTNHVFYAVP